MPGEANTSLEFAKERLISVIDCIKTTRPYLSEVKLEGKLLFGLVHAVEIFLAALKEDTKWES